MTLENNSPADNILPEVDVHQAKDMIAEGALLVDVREEDEYIKGHIARAQLMPMSSMQQTYTTLPKDKKIVLQCHMGSRSAKVTEYLKAQGYNVYNMTGGILAWQQAGLPVEKS